MPSGPLTAADPPDQPTVEPAREADATGAGDDQRDRPGRLASHRRGRIALIAGAVVVAGALVAAGVWWFGVRADGNATAAGTATAKRLVPATTGSIDTTVTAQGTLAAAATDDLTFTSAGKVTAVKVSAGDHVKAGQVLATMDSASLQAAFATAQASHLSAVAQLSDDQAADASADQIAADESNVVVTQDALASAFAGLSGASLVSTIDGTVTTVNLTVGEQLSSSGTGGTSLTGSASGSGNSSGNLGSVGGNGNGSNNADSSSGSSPQIEVVSTGRFSVDVAVAASDISGVKVGQNATVTVAAASSSNALGRFGGGFAGGAFAGGQGFPGGGRRATTGSVGATATGKVTSVSKIASASTGVATYPVTVTLSADTNSFVIGATVNADIVTGQRNGVLLVPALALSSANGRPTVMVASTNDANGPTAVRTVTTGATSNGMIEITSGLRAGDRVVITLPSRFANGGNRTGNGGGSGGFPGGSEGGGFGGFGPRNGRTGTGTGSGNGGGGQ
jgi:macrolide-specific efflux system membrane fusion protein